MNEPAELLRSDQVELRRWRATHLDALDRAIHESMDHLLPWMPWAAGSDRQRTAEFLARVHGEWEDREAFNYAITTDGQVVGACGLMRRIGPGGLDVGYWLHPRWTGRGLVTMATEVLVDQGFRLTGIDRVEIHHDAANPASGAVADRLGFTEVERVPVAEGPTAPGEVGINVIWRMTAERWAARERLSKG
jgi:RimJ/RimL family protein N-acetyltransferase